MATRHRVDHEPATPAYERHIAEVDNEFSPEPAFAMARLRRVMAAFEAALVPDDAYVQFGQPTAWASWQRPHRDYPGKSFDQMTPDEQTGATELMAVIVTGTCSDCGHSLDAHHGAAVCLEPLCPCGHPGGRNG